MGSSTASSSIHLYNHWIIEAVYQLSQCPFVLAQHFVHFHGFHVHVYLLLLVWCILIVKMLLGDGLHVFMSTLMVFFRGEGSVLQNFLRCLSCYEL